MKIGAIQKALVVAFALAVPFAASAQEAGESLEVSSGDDGGVSDGGGLSLGALFGYGIDFEDGDVNPFGVTLGARAGFTMDSNLYIGGTGIFHVGESEETSLGGITVESSLRMLQIGAEVGYDLHTSSLLIRPYAGLGLNVAFISATVSGTGGTDMDTSDSETDLYLNLGGALLYPIDNFFVGGDVHLANVFSDETLTGLVFALTAGLNL